MQWQAEQEAAMEKGSHPRGQRHYNYDAVAFNYIPQREWQQNNAHVAHTMLHVASRAMRMF